MEKAPAGTSPAPMEGHGAYNRSSCVQAAGSSVAVSLLEQAARSVDLPALPAPIVIADYGSSQGANSMAPITAAIAALRSRSDPGQEVSVVHTDLPDNDFQALFRTLATHDASYLRADRAAFASAVGRSFYEQILPSASVTLGWSSWAVQWLSTVPALIPDQVQVAFSRDPTVRAAFAAQAARDWRTFLTHRGREFRPGGRLVVLTMALTGEGAFGYRPILDAIDATLRRLVAEGWLDPSEMRRMAIPTVGRSLADIREPFGQDGRFAGLSLEHAEFFLGQDPIWESFTRDCDAGAFGRRWAAFSRASVLPTLARELDEARAAAFMDRVEAGMAAALAHAPQPMVIPLAAAVLARHRP
jgi:hypothetical protein